MIKRKMLLALVAALSLVAGAAAGTPPACQLEDTDISMEVIVWARRFACSP